MFASSEAKEFLSLLLDVNPDTRYTAEQALHHPWLQSKDKKRMKESLLESPRFLNSTSASVNQDEKNKGNGSKTRQPQQIKAADLAKIRAKASAITGVDDMQNPPLTRESSI